MGSVECRLTPVDGWIEDVVEHSEDGGSRDPSPRCYQRPEMEHSVDPKMTDHDRHWDQDGACHPPCFTSKDKINKRQE